MAFEPSGVRAVAMGLRALALVLVVAGCARSGERPSPSTAYLAAGQPIDVANLAMPTDCDSRLRSEIDAAIAIRRSLHVDGVSPDRQAVEAAAADPTSTLVEIGVPITSAERQALSANGLSVGDNLPLGEWVFDGAPQRFGGIWIDPPGSGQYVVSILRADPTSLALARCVAALTNLPTRFVVATVSKQDGEALKDRITSDSDRLTSEGIPLTSVDYDETRGIVVIGVDKPTDAMVARLHQLYGPSVEIIDEQPAVAL